MRFAALAVTLLLASLLLAGGCSDSKAKDAGPDADAGALERPGALPRPPAGRLPPELRPPR